MKKGDQIKLNKSLCEGAKFEGFVSEDPEVATVNELGIVEAVGLGETTITAKAKLKGSSKIYTATCRVIVTGLIAESMEIKGADSTVKGTVYGTYGKKVVDGNLSEVGIGDVIDIVQDNSSGTPKDIVSIKDTVIAENSGWIKVESKLTVNAEGTFTIQKDKTGSGILNVFDTFDIYGTVNISSGCYIGTKNEGIINIYGIINTTQGSQIESSTKFNIQSGGIANLQSTTICTPFTFTVESGGTLNLQHTLYDTKINVKSGGVVNVQKGSKISSEQLIPNATTFSNSSSDSIFDINGGILNLQKGSKISAEVINLQAGSTINVLDGATVQLGGTNYTAGTYNF